MKLSLCFLGDIDGGIEYEALDVCASCDEPPVWLSLA